MPPPPAAPEKRPQADVGQEHDRPHEDRHEGHEADVEVPDMREFVGEDALEFVPPEPLAQAARDGDGGVLGVAAGGEGVHRGRVDDVQFRHGKAGGDGKFLDDVVELRVVLLGDGARAAHREDRARPRVVADQGHDQRNRQRQDDAGDGGARVAEEGPPEHAAEDADEEDK